MMNLKKERKIAMKPYKNYNSMAKEMTLVDSMFERAANLLIHSGKTKKCYNKLKIISCWNSIY